MYNFLYTRRLKQVEDSVTMYPVAKRRISINQRQNNRLRKSIRSGATLSNNNRAHGVYPFIYRRRGDCFSNYGKQVARARNPLLIFRIL